MVVAEPIVGIIGAGAMGSGVGRRLVDGGARVLTPLDGRSDAARARAAAAGMEPALFAALCDADIVLSIVPPGSAMAVAEAFVEAVRKQGHTATFVDCNAVDVRTVQRIGQAIAGAGVSFVDAGIIGLPPAAGSAGPTFYMSGEPAGGIASMLAGLGLTVRAMDGPVGSASALKMSYAGITKGLAAIASIMVLGAHRAGASSALQAELAASQPQLLNRFGKMLPDMVPKAYRWVAEMREIASFLGDDPAGAAVFEGIAQFYERVAADAVGDRHEVEIIETFAA